MDKCVRILDRQEVGRDDTRIIRTCNIPKKNLTYNKNPVNYENNCSVNAKHVLNAHKYYLEVYVSSARCH